MTLPRIEHVPGAPMYGPLRSFTAHTWHTTEGAAGLAGAIATARWQATAGNTSGGSYHGILALDPAGAAVLVVTAPLEEAWPADRAVGGVHRGSSAWRPSGRVLNLPAAVLADPNAHLRQYALAGRTADFIRDGYPPALVAAAAAMVREDERRHPGIDPWQTGHYEYQANRSDPGPEWIPELLTAYRAGAPLPAPPADLSALVELWPEDRPTVRLLEAAPAGVLVYVNRGSELHPRWSNARTPAVKAGHRFTAGGRAIVTLADGRRRPCWKLHAPGYPHHGAYLDERLAEGVGIR